MHQCPKCNSDDVHRSRSKTRVEAWRRQITGKRPARCRACGWRGWGVDPGPKFSDEETNLSTRAMAPDPPNLRDSALAPDEQRASVNIEQLDALNTLFAKRE